MDDLLALCVSQLVSFRTGKKPEGELYTWKDFALSKSGVIIRSITDTPLQKIRQGFMMIARMVGKKQDGGKNNP